VDDVEKLDEWLLKRTDKHPVIELFLRTGLASAGLLRARGKHAKYWMCARSDAGKDH
jgi:hypothetical protein